jgi:hypothetical protein
LATKLTLTYNYSVGEEYQDPKAVEIQEKKVLEMLLKDHLPQVSILSALPAILDCIKKLRTINVSSVMHL